MSAYACFAEGFSRASGGLLVRRRCNLIHSTEADAWEHLADMIDQVNGVGVRRADRYYRFFVREVTA